MLTKAGSKDGKGIVMIDLQQHCIVASQGRDLACRDFDQGGGTGQSFPRQTFSAPHPSATRDMK